MSSGLEKVEINKGIENLSLVATRHVQPLTRCHKYAFLVFKGSQVTDVWFKTSCKGLGLKIS